MDLQEQVGRGDYRVDAQAVADAILRRILAERLQREVTRDPQSA